MGKSKFGETTRSAPAAAISARSVVAAIWIVNSQCEFHLPVAMSQPALLQTQKA